MPIKHADFIIKGMHRDLSESAFSSEYSYENQNIRITTDKNDSSKHTGDLMALTNERGNKYTPIIGLESQDMQGVPIGQCMINNQWVVFYTNKTKNVEFSESAIESVVEQGEGLNLAGEESEIDNLVESSNDKIYRLWMNEDKLYGELLYEGNLGFDWKYPIETLGYYENENIQKVYWTDGLNQPRFINIVEKPEKKALWNDKSFDFVPIINLLDHKITITEKPTGGRFPAGVIQWHFTYSKQFGQETAIFESTKLYELKFVDRGAAPDEETSQSFNITIENPDTNFDFVNIYSTIRTSLDNVPIAKCVATIPIIGNKISFTDTNLYGYAIDPQELLYKGGEIIAAYTMESKDNTLFLGNYTLKRNYIPNNIREEFKNKVKNKGLFDFRLQPLNSVDDKDTSEPYFKDGNTYRFGIQFQHITGKWSEVVWIGDYQCDKTITKGYDGTEYKWLKPFANMKIDSSLRSSIQHIIDSGYVKARPVVVYPSLKERSFVCQGLWSNTLYESSQENKIYPDYFLRFLRKNAINVDYSIYSSDRTWYSKKCCYSPNISPVNYEPSEFDNEYTERLKFNANGIELVSNRLKCNKYIYSLYSPDVEFNDSYKIDSYEDVDIYMVRYGTGLSPLRLETEIETSSISKSIEGRPQWEDSGREICFKNVINETHDVHTSDNHKGYHGVICTKKVEVEGDTLNTAVTSRFWGYGDDSTWSWHYANCGFAKAVREPENYFNYMTRYPLRLNGFKPKMSDDLHYVGGYIWADNLFNIRTVHSELTNRDVPVNSASFMQLYFNYTYPVFLWQHSGSICYDNAETGASSVLKSNKILQEFEVSNLNNANTESIKAKNVKSIYGRNIIKIDSDTLYSSNIDTILAFTTAYTAIVDKNPDCLAPTPTIKHNTGYEKMLTSWDAGVDGGRSVNSRGDDVWNIDNCCLYRTNANGGVDFNTSLIVPLFENGLPVDHYWKQIGTDSTDDTWGFNWFDSSMEKIGAPQTVDVKYSSVPHLVVQIEDTDDIVNKWNSGNYNDIIPIVEVRQKVSENIFGGTSDSVLQTNNFLVAGKSVPIATKVNDKYVSLLNSGVINIKWTIGDVYLQDYELLKTYPLTFEAENCITEVIKVKLETYWNMNCRYDTWKGNPTFATSPANWNLMNPVYNQKDNFFVYHGLDLSTNSIDDFPNSFTWSKTKWAGDATDKWTHITLASNMDVDGSKGRITRLIKLQDNLLCFQPRGLSQILYNEREQIATGSGVPIELANSGKVSGVRYVTERTGCNNKWSICKNETGLYWVDDENKAIMAWNQQLANLSDTLGFHSWINAKSNLLVWNPIEFDSFVTYYDPFNESVMFFYKDNMLSYNTQLNCFDSFFSYGYVPYYIAFNGTAFTLSDRDSDGRDTYKVWEQHKGDYNYFYVQDKCTYDSDMNIISKGKYDIYGSPTDYGFEPYYITLLVNPDMPYDKIFTNLDMRTDMWNKNKELLEETFSHIHVWNEFQENKSTLIRNVDVPKIHLPAQHSILKKKFRVWYVDIPRDKKHPDARFYKRDRMRNTWLYVKLSKELIDDDDMITYPYISDNKHIIHHIGVSYFV